MWRALCLQVELDHPDHEAFPELESLPFKDCVLEPGQMLYVPPGWWHYVKAPKRIRDELSIPPDENVTSAPRQRAANS